MPVRMRKDPERSSGKDNFPGRRPTSGGGSGGGSGLIGALLPLLLKNPKLMLIGAIIFGAIYFFGGGNCGGGGGGITDVVKDVTDNIFSTGATLSPEKYDATEIFEPLADNIKNPLPEKYSLLKYAPSRLNQGAQGSCVAWASSYAARSILEAKATGASGDAVAFSPSYLYNQIALSNCQGSYLPEAMKSLQNGGVLPYKEFKYDDQSCSEKPDAEDKRRAAQYKIHGFNRLSKGDNIKEIDMLSIKQHLSQGAPVVIGMMVGGSFMRGMEGQDVWLPESADYDMSGFGGHAMCVIGYDDYKEGGAFQIMNSWGTAWGNKGVAWVRYKDFDYFVKEAYGIDPLGDADAPRGEKLQAKVSIALNDKVEMGFKKAMEGFFVTAAPMKAGDLFKVEVTNNLPCHIYVFGQETDGSSYVLFPYTPKHSPYCGITGTRLFPSDYSMELDAVGNQDQMAVVISKDPIDYNEFNKLLSSGSGTYAQRLAAIKGMKVSGTTTQNNGLLLNADFSSESMVGAVFAFDK
jgi:hypothetical protein